MVVEVAYSDHPAGPSSTTTSSPSTSSPLPSDEGKNGIKWIPIGSSTSFPEICPGQRIAAPPSDPWDEVPSAEKPRCKIFKIDTSQNSEGSEMETLTEIPLSEAQLYCSWQPQLLVFRNKGRVWAIRHACPHRRAALSRGRLVDLEDAGGGGAGEGGAVGLVCAVHGWAFELESGMGSKGISVGVWETREVEGSVWVRRRG